MGGERDGERDGEREVGMAEAARLLGISPDAVRMRVKRGSLAAAKVDGVWRIRLPLASADMNAIPGASPYATPDAAPAALLARLQGENARLADENTWLRRQVEGQRDALNDMATKLSLLEALQATTSQAGERLRAIEAVVRPSASASPDATGHTGATDPDARANGWKNATGNATGNGTDLRRRSSWWRRLLFGEEWAE